MDIIMYPHGGSGNRGCEAIVRSTCKLLGDHSYTLFSTHEEEDQAVQLNRLCKILPQISKTSRFSLDYLKAAFQFRVLNDKDAFDYLAFKQIFDQCNDRTLALSIGGDNYCYGEARHIYLINKYVRQKNAKNVLWGCSVDEKGISSEMCEDLKGYDFIYARESLTFQTLKQINPNTKIYPDPAFQLDKIDRPLPAGFEQGNTVGINVSPLIMNYEESNGITYKNYRTLISDILKNTNMKIALIAHVIWEVSDDRKPLHRLYEEFKNSGRVIEIFSGNCEELKGYISRCRFLICARTHASIAAYSTCVPTLVVGYSVKARGIATDIFGTDHNYVIPVQQLKNEADLLRAFQWLTEHEHEIHSHLVSFMPSYKEQVWKAKEDIMALCGR